MRPEGISVAQAATALGVSAPTARAWARRGLIEVVREHPMMVSFPSVVDLRRDLERLRQTAGNEKRWQALQPTNASSPSPAHARGSATHSPATQSP